MYLHFVGQFCYGIFASLKYLIPEKRAKISNALHIKYCTIKMEWTLSTENLVAELREKRFYEKTGSSTFEIDKCISLAVVFNIITTILVNILFQTRKSNHPFLIFILEFFGCIFPLVVSLTSLSDHIYDIYGTLIPLIVVVYFWLLLRRDLWPMLFENVRIKDSKLPCITHFRALVNVFSVICILAADFHVFPERFLKTEYYGYSLMDTGVGLFVVNLALGSSHSRRRRINLSTFFKHFIPLSIGIGRFLAVRSVDYQHQIFEYGVHWNFFVTLAIIGIFNEFSFRVVNSTKSILIFSIVLLVSYEFVLNVGLRDWIFGFAPRDNFISANREGICSIVGYQVLYLWGVVMKRLLPRKGDVFEQYRQSVRYFLLFYSIISLFNRFTYDYLPPSRRCANAGYVLWIITIVLFYLTFLIAFELSTVLWNIQMKTKINRTVPVILESVNFNGLSFFLLANLLTGVINLSMHTLLIRNELHSLIIITCYIFICCSFTSLLYAKQWRIR